MTPIDRLAARRKTPVMLQMEATECGAACLGMILGYFGRFEPLEKLREECGVSRNGSKASLILQAARGYGLEAKGFRALTEQLDELPYPMILFWNFDHFVVYEGHNRSGKYFYLNDPAIGPRTVPRDLFEKSFTGVTLTFEKTPEFSKGGKPLNVIAAMLPMLRGMKSVISAVIWGGLLLVLPGIIIPTLMRVFVDKVMRDRSEWLVPLLLCFALTVLLQILLDWLVKLALRRGELQLAVNRTLGMLRYLFRLPMQFFLQRSSGDLQNRIGLNYSVANTAFGTVADNIVKFFTAVFFLGLMLQFSVPLSCFAVFFALTDLLFLYWINRRRQVLNQSLMMLQTKMLSSVMSGIGMIENLRAAGREDAMFLQWTGQLAELNRKQLQFQVSTAYFNLLPTFLNGLGGVIILCFGAWQIMSGDLTLGGMFAFQILMSSFTGPFTSLMLSGSELQTMKADIERINDVYKYEPEHTFKAGDADAKLPDYAGFEMKDITFGYSRTASPLLEGFSLKVTPGKRIALVGISGSGKSTVAKLASGVLQPWGGEIRLNGRPISDYTREQYYGSIGTVDQSIMLFSGNIRDNLTLFSPKFDAGELQAAVRDAALETELTSRGGNMLDLHVAEGGGNFSGGQRQRLEIARVLAYRTPLLILDEATSSLDPVTEVEIDNAIRRRGCTCIIVAHRLSTIRDCDEIIMLDNGRIMERGTHTELMRQQGQYAELMLLEGGEPA